MGLGESAAPWAREKASVGSSAARPTSGAELAARSALPSWRGSEFQGPGGAQPNDHGAARDAPQSRSKTLAPSKLSK
eukprot:5264828-Pyramimonas_sp.AAC.1